MSLDERRDFLAWVDGEIARLRAGGEVPTSWLGTPECWHGTREEMIESLEAEKSRWPADAEPLPLKSV